MSDGKLDRVMEIAELCCGIEVAKLSPNSALDQEMHLYGVGVWDFEAELASLFGGFVYEWPWHRFTEGSEKTFGWPFSNIYNRLKWGYWSGYWPSHKFERLELGHIAAVIEKGEWFEP